MALYTFKPKLSSQQLDKPGKKPIHSFPLAFGMGYEDLYILCFCPVRFKGKTRYIGDILSNLIMRFNSQ